MKTKISLAPVLLLIISLLSTSCEMGAKRGANNAMQEIMDGNLRWTTRSGQPYMAYDFSALEVSYSIVDHFYAEKWEQRDWTKPGGLEMTFFDFPVGVHSFELIESSNMPDSERFDIIDISEVNFYTTDHLRNSHDNYEEFKKYYLDLYSNDPFFEYDDEKGFIRVKRVVPEIRYKYRVKTNSGVQLYTVAMVKGYDSWAVGAVMRHREND
jgi:hypothetical protein